ncbi:6-hydroxymethylpterin diphosphokinase MptE-like protein [Leptospira perolatii]|uniref:6-hydroxymethylpterin diphosphokinase MptE-like protein n=1 Tax=Leptospira perolatii TaxID=2023191 RepID=UPI0013FDEC10|nr:6-hydroxymethylpterin diphosphokinase MptE-like protein [Leptospira perolatii]
MATVKGKLLTFVRRTFPYLGIFYNENDRKIFSLRKRYEGESCFIIGNGPSLTADDLELVKKTGFRSFGVNKIYLIYDQTDWRPDFYVCEDVPFIESALSGIEAVEAKIKFLTKVKGLSETEGTIWIKRIETYFDAKPQFFSNPIPHVFCGQTVIYICMQYALYMGFKKIYLLGVDFNWKLDGIEQDEKYLSVITKDENHFHPEYFKPGEKQYLPTRDHYNFMIKCLELARKVSGIQDTTIYNATRGGKLEVFERISLEDLLLSIPASKEKLHSLGQS